MIPVYEHLYAGAEDEYVMNALLAKGISGHSKSVRAFEERFADYIGVQHAIATSSGTAALETALHAVGVQEGDEVVLPSFTIISCAIAVLRVGAVPVLVDVDPESWCIDSVGVERAITEKTKAVMPVDMFGHPAREMFSMIDWGRPIAIVEDACQAHGTTATYDGRMCGKVGDAAAFSFYYNKLITTGEGGAVTTDDPDIAKRARSYRNLYLGTGPDRFRCTALGNNYRMGGLQAALGCAQLESVDEFLAIKRRNARMYRNRLAGVSGLQFQVEQPWAKSAHWMVGVVTERPAVEVMARLEEKGVESRPFFYPLHEQPGLMGKWRLVDTFPVTEHLYKHGVILPSGLTLQDSDIDYVCDSVKEVLS
jgi:perosamine synthetase